MNLLFVNYGDCSTNSLNHIAPFANHLTERGHDCIVAVPGNLASRSIVDRVIFSVATYEDVLTSDRHFANGQPADILHAWCPRQRVFEFTRRYLVHYHSKLIVHLEDNEDAVLEGYYNIPIQDLKRRAIANDGTEWEPSLSHPLGSKAFIALADGFTAVTRSLLEFTLTDKPAIELLPGLEPPTAEISPGEVGMFKAGLGLESDEPLLVYPGGVSANTLGDLANLYRAIRFLNDNGRRIRLIKTGPNSPRLAEEAGVELRDIVIDLGMVPKSRVLALIQAADVLVQPGADDSFNHYRLPSKLPEFLAAGRPVITSRANIGEALAKKNACFLLENSAPEDIAGSIESALADSVYAERIAENGRAFAEEHFSLQRNGDGLARFYARVRDSREPRIWPSSRSGRALPKKWARRASEIQQRERLRASPSHAPTPEDLLAYTKLFRSEQGRWATPRPIDPSQSVWRSLKAILSAKRGRFRAAASTFPPSGPAVRDSVAPSPDEPDQVKVYAARTEQEAIERTEYLAGFRERLSSLRRTPLVSVIMPVHKVELRFLRRAIESVIEQAYPRWELCIAEDATGDEEITDLIKRFTACDGRIKAVFRPARGHICACSNAAISLAQGDFLCFLDHDDELSPDALAKVAESLNATPSACIVYSDEDKIDEEGHRHSPHFKSDWNPDLLLCQNYINHLTVIRADLVRQLNGLREGMEGAQDWDLLLRASRLVDPRQIIHIPEVLYHWRATSRSTARDPSTKHYARHASRDALADRLRLEQTGNHLELRPNGHWLVQRPTPNVRGSILIVAISPIAPSLFEHARRLDRTLKLSDAIQIVEINPSSMGEEGAGNATVSTRPSEPLHGSDSVVQQMNQLIKERRSTSIVFLIGPETTPATHESFRQLLAHAVRLEIGVASGKLLCANGAVFSAGIVLSEDIGFRRAFQGSASTAEGHFQRALLDSNYSAVDPTCMCFRRSVWEELDGFQEGQLCYEHACIDFCLRARRAGYLNLYTAEATLTTLRCLDEPAQENRHVQQSMLALRSNWAELLDRDPYFNRNLTTTYGRFSLRATGTPPNIIQRSEANRMNDNPNRMFNDRHDYKGTWEELSTTQEQAMLHVAGHTDLPEFARSADVTVSVLRSTVGIEPSDTFLEIGCGIGRVGKALSPHVSRWIGTDISSGMIAAAKDYLEECSNVDLIELSAPTLDRIPDASIDVVYCTVVFMHLLEWDRYHYVQEAFRVLKPGGRCYFDNVDILTDHGWEVFLAGYRMERDKRPAHLSTVSSADELLTYGKRAGFADSTIHRWGGAWVALTGVKKQ